jgi:L-alanine-DL-glutamate epimerase-like enolase superfamily enzyme
MKLTSVRIIAHTKHPFRIARPHGSVEGTEVRRIIVRLEHEGTVGFGEAAPVMYYGQSLESVETTLDRIQSEPELFGRDPFQIVPIIERLILRFPDQRATVAAVDAALHDWIGRKLGVPVWRLLGLDATQTPPTSMTIGIDAPDLIARKVEQVAAFSALKVKVGTAQDEQTLSIIREAAPRKSLRLDANTAWTPENALQRISDLARFEPELIEQPLESRQYDALRQLHERSPVPVFADEDSVTAEDLPAVAGCVAGVNIKLAKCGGIREALRMIYVARAFGLKVMLGCMVETSLGIAAAAHIASLVDVVDLDGHLLLDDDPFDALLLQGDRVLPKDRPGLGADPSGLFGEGDAT